MMDPLLHDYEETFVHAVESANSLASQATSYTDDPSQGTRLVRSAEERLGEAAEALETLESHILGMDRASRAAAQSKARQLRSTLESTKEAIKRAGRQVERESLLSDGGNDLSQTSHDQRSRVMATSERMERSADALSGARRTVAETEDVASGITEELARNRETIMSSKQRVGEIRGTTNRASTLLRRMGRRELKFKIMIGFLILSLLGGISALIYVLGKNSGGSNSGSN